VAADRRPLSSPRDGRRTLDDGARGLNCQTLNLGVSNGLFEPFPQQKEIMSYYIEKYTPERKNGTTKTRGAKLFVTNPEDLDEILWPHMGRWCRMANRLVRHIIKGLNKGDYVLKDSKDPRCIYHKGFALGVRDKFQAKLESIGLVMKGLQNEVVTRAMRLVDGFVSRYDNFDPAKKKLNAPQCKKVASMAVNATHFFDETVFGEDKLGIDFKAMPKDERDKVGMDLRRGVAVLTIQGDRAKNTQVKLRIEYIVPEGMVRNKYFLNLLKGQHFGGYLVADNRGYHFSAGAEIPYEFAYQPLTFIGTDFNQDQRFLMTLSDGSIKRLNKALGEANRRIDALNKELRSGNLTKSEMRGVRKRIKTWQKKQLDAAKEYCEWLVAKAIREKACICIDDVKVGKICGTFGHDAIKKLLVPMCEDRRIPFVLVPSYFTSMAHLSGCGKCMKQEKEEGDDGHYRYCPHCKKQVCSHINAAKNNAILGQMIWEGGKKAYWAWHEAWKESSGWRPQAEVDAEVNARRRAARGEAPKKRRRTKKQMAEQDAKVNSDYERTLKVYQEALNATAC
jgi:hypothetical protein